MGRKRAVRLPELESEIGDISQRATAIFRSIDHHTAARRPKEGSWSAVECLEHLNLSADPYFPLWEDALAQARRRIGPPDRPYRMDFWGRVLVWTLEPPPKMPIRTSTPFCPAQSLDVAQTLEGFLERQSRIVSVFRKCDSLAIDRVKIASPFDRRVRYSVWSSFLLICAHERRHLWQAERALNALGIRAG